MYYMLEWMLVSSIPHVDGACIMAAIFRYCFAYYVCKIFLSVNFQDINEILLLLLLLLLIPVYNQYFTRPKHVLH